MSEEEKKAIKELKEFAYSQNGCFSAGNAKKIINLIEKLQKELEQEKEKNKELKERILKALNILDTKPYTAYTLYGDILHENENVIEILSNKDWTDFEYEEYKKELLEE